MRARRYNPEVCNRSREGGFTLVEVLVSLLIFAVGVMAAYGLQLQSMQMNTFAKEMTEASSAARMKMEELKGLQFIDPKLSDRNGDGAAGLDAETSDAADHSDGSIFWNIAEDPLLGMKTVHVIYTFDWRGEKKRVTYRTILAKEG